MSTTTDSPKKDVSELVSGLPESATWDDIEYAIYVRRKIREGQASVRRGEFVSSEEARRRFQKWLE